MRGSASRIRYGGGSGPWKGESVGRYRLHSFSPRGFLRLVTAALYASLWLLAPLSASYGNESELRAAESLVRTDYYEGLPLREASRLSPLAATHLASLLDDPDEARWHPNILIALGMAGHPDSYEALLRHGIDHSGELNRNEYRALLARVAAFGHLASREPRALAWLEEAVRHPVAEPNVSLGAMRGERLARQLLARAVAALALSGSDSAAELLANLRAEGKVRAAGAIRLSPASLDAALAGLERVRVQGREKALASPFETQAGEGVKP